MPSPPKGGGSKSPSIVPILTVNFVGTLGFSIVVPFLVFLVARWGGNALIYGLMGATYSAFQLVGAPILGRWSDRYGRKKILLLSQLGTLLAWLIFVLAFYLPTEQLTTINSSALGTFAITLPLIALFVARALDGLTGGNVSVANAYLADITPDEDRSRNFGRMAVAANLGFVLGPALAGVLGGTEMGELLPVLAAVGISVIASALILGSLKELRPEPFQADPESGRPGGLLRPDHKACIELETKGRISFSQAIKMQCIGRLLTIYFLVMMGFNFFYVAFPMFAVQDLAWDVRQTGTFFAVLSLLMALVQGPILSRVARAVSDGTLAVVGSLILASCFPLLSLETLPAIYGSAALLALGNGLMWPSVLSLLSRAAGSTHQGTIQGFAGSVGAVASILGLLCGGLLFDELGAGVFYIASALIVLVAIISVPLRTQLRDLEPQKT